MAFFANLKPTEISKISLKSFEHLFSLPKNGVILLWFFNVIIHKAFHFMLLAEVY